MHEYARRLRLALARPISRQIVKGKTIVNVFHDSWCLVYEKQHCNCDPDIIFVTNVGEWHIGRDGTITRAPDPPLQ